MIRVGPAGWSYDDWQDIVYPRGRANLRLAALARLFPTIEINSSFYRSPAARSAERWAAEVAEIPGFRFTVKLQRSFTHEDPRTWTLATRDDFRAGVQPLWEADVLGAVLAQFPWTFRVDPSAWRRLERIGKAFPDLPKVLEVRHRSWLESSVLDRVSALGFSICNMDMPQSGSSIPLAHRVTGPIGYLRLHGRNAQKWFDPKAQVHERYDYLYDEHQLQRILEEAAKIRDRTEDLYVIANNHFEGKGPANALEIQSALTGRVPPIPESLLAKYPRLSTLRSAESEP